MGISENMTTNDEVIEDLVCVKGGSELDVCTE